MLSEGTCRLARSPGSGSHSRLLRWPPVRLDRRGEAVTGITGAEQRRTPALGSVGVPRERRFASARRRPCRQRVEERLRAPIGRGPRFGEASVCRGRRCDLVDAHREPPGSGEGPAHWRSLRAEPARRSSTPRAGGRGSQRRAITARWTAHRSSAARPTEPWPLLSRTARLRGGRAEVSIRLTAAAILCSGAEGHGRRVIDGTRTGDGDREREKPQGCDPCRAGGTTKGESPTNTALRA